MESNSSARRVRGLTRIAIAMAGALLLAVSSGCAMTQVVGEDDGSVSEASARRDLGIDYLSTHKTAMAIREFRASLEEDPSDPVTHLWLGEALGWDVILGGGLIVASVLLAAW